MGRSTIVVTALIVVALLAWAGWALYDAGHLTRAGLIGLAQNNGGWAPLLLIAAMVLAVVVGPIPTIPISIASGVIFGVPTGFTLATIGALLGAWISFHIGRAVGQPVIQRLLGGHALFCPHCSTRLLFWVVLVTRLVPIISFAAVSYGAGLTAMRAGAFLLATAIGMTPMTLLYVGIGAAVEIDPVIAAIGGAIAVILMIVLPRFVERHDPFGLRRIMIHDELPPAE